MSNLCAVYWGLYSSFGRLFCALRVYYHCIEGGGGGRGAAHWRNLIISSVHRDTISAIGGYHQRIGEYHDLCGGISSVIISASGVYSTLWVYHQC